MREYSFFLKNGQKPRIDPWAYIGGSGNTVIIIRAYDEMLLPHTKVERLIIFGYFVHGQSVEYTGRSYPIGNCYKQIHLKTILIMYHLLQLISAYFFT